MKYALLIAFTYHRSINGDSKIVRLMGACNDIRMMTIFCKTKNIPASNITILTDLSELPRECLDCNIKTERYPISEFVCRELAQFVENTIRGIEDGVCKSETNLPEVLVYISGHGSKINVTIPEVRDEQALVLLDDDGTCLKYLTTKDIFNILFGRLPISRDGLIEIPIYTKTVKRVHISTTTLKRYEEEIQSDVDLVSVYLSPIVSSPANSPGMTAKSYRSTYLSNRGIPPWTRVLFVIDCCHSGHMTHFPYIYSQREQKMHSFKLENTFVSHSDMPYCVCISACDADKTTSGGHEGSPLTRIIYTHLRNIEEQLTLCQFYFSITNTGNSIFRNYFTNSTLTPVLSSTGNDSDMKVPFFSNDFIVVPKKIKK
jgi:hypothetical protein